MHHDVEIVPHGFPVFFGNDDPEALKRPEHQLDIIVDERKEEVDKILPFLRPQDTHNPKIQKDDVSFLV